LKDFLGRYRDGAPSLLVSAGFPALLPPGGSPLRTLPAPALPPPPGEGRSLADQVVEGMLRKAREEARYLPLEQWHKISGGLCAKALDDARREASEELRWLQRAGQMHPVTRTAVDRITGSAREGRLFVAEETFHGPPEPRDPDSPAPAFDVWHKLDDGDDGLLGRLDTWWRWVERNGFGRRKSAGHGAFRIEGGGLVEAGGELPQVGEPNGFVTLSAWVPRQGDPTDLTYSTRIKRGKLAETLALPSPWKKPLLMLEPGAVACLDAGEDMREWYGGLVEDMHWTEKGIVQYGYAFPLAVRVLS
jgi:hypothetical protein